MIARAMNGRYVRLKPCCAFHSVFLAARDDVDVREVDFDDAEGVRADGLAHHHVVAGELADLGQADRRVAFADGDRGSGGGRAAGAGAGADAGACSRAGEDEPGSGATAPAAGAVGCSADASGPPCGTEAASGACFVAPVASM